LRPLVSSMIERRDWPVKLGACSVVLRVRKEDSAYLYKILESYEGIANFSTVSEGKNLAHRDIRLHIAPDLRGEVLVLVERLKGEIDLEVIA
jgi:translation initiation factor 2 alpha subunit (eIF-2alpha)